MKTILSIDGGGIFGLIPVQVLQEVEQRTGEPIASKFDLIAGNSAGAIISSLIAHGKSAEEVSQILQQEMPKIFKRSLWRKARTVNGFLGPKYLSDHSEKVAREHLSIPMGQAITRLMLVSYDMLQREPYFFKSWRDRNFDTLTYEGVLASSAAPTFFAPRDFSGEGITRNLVDGAIVANNPAMCAYAEACKLWPTEPICLVSLGTGKIRVSYSNSKSRKWGLLDWATKIAGLILDGGIDAVDYQLNQINSIEKSLRYVRVDARFEKNEVSSMDDASRKHISKLIIKGRQLADERVGEIVDILT